MGRLHSLLRIALLTGILSMASFAEAQNNPAETYIPYDIKDAVITLGELLPSDWDTLSETDRQMATRPLLMQIRNMWFHGTGKNPRLKHYFHRKGVYNAELMSGIIWAAYQATVGRSRFSIPNTITEYVTAYPNNVNRFVCDESTPMPKEVTSLWRAYLLQKDDLTAVQIFCDDTGALQWVYDPDGGWSPVSDHIRNVVATKRAIRLKLGYEDDGKIPIEKAIRRIKNPLTPPPARTPP